MSIRTLLMLLAFAASAFALGACGGDGDGGSGLPPAGEQRFTVTGTLEVEFLEEGVSASPIALQGTETGEVSGSLTIEFNDDGSFTIPELNLTASFEDNVITITPADEPSTGNVTPDGTTVNLNVEIAVDSGAPATNETPIELESPDTLGVDSEVTLTRPEDAEPVSFTPIEGYRELSDFGLVLLLIIEQEAREATEEARQTQEAKESTPPPAAPTDTPPPAEATTPPEVSEAQLNAAADQFATLQGDFLGGFTRDDARSGVVSNEDWIAGSLNVADAPNVVDQFNRSTGYRVEWFASSAQAAYQARLSLTAFGSEGDARGYLENLVPFWQAGVGTQSAHEEVLAGVTPFKLRGTLGPDALGITLEFSAPGTDRGYYQTYVAFTENNVRGSISFFTITAPPPSGQVRDQAEELAASLQQAVRQALGQ